MDAVVDGMKVAKLKAKLKNRGRPVSGAKGVFVLCLKVAMVQGMPVAETIPERHACMNNLGVTAFWEVMKPNARPVPEPKNIDPDFCPPTERDTPITAKYGYVEQFEKAHFRGTTTKIPRQKLGHQSKTAIMLGVLHAVSAAELQVVVGIVALGDGGEYCEYIQDDGEFVSMEGNQTAIWTS